MISKILIRSLAISILCLAVFACTQEKKKRVINFPKTDLATENLIPKPLQVIATEGGFALDAFTAIYTSNTEGFPEVGQFLSEKIKGKTQLDIPVNVEEVPKMEGVIYINKSDSLALATPESYQLYIRPDSVILNSNKPMVDSNTKLNNSLPYSWTLR